MNIGILTPGFSAHEGDWAIPVLEDLIRLLAAEHSVRVFSLRYPATKGIYPVYKAQVAALAGGDAAGLRRLPLLLRSLRAVIRAHRARPFDLLHAFWGDEPGSVAVLAGRRLGVPALVSLMGGELARYSDIGYGGHLSRINRLLTRYSINRADLVTAGSALLAELAEAQYPRARIARLPLGLDDRWFAPCPGETPPGFDPGVLHVLSAASLVPVKDPAALLKAFALATGSDASIHLHLAGGGPLRQSLELQSGALGLQGRVTFHGRLPHRMMPPVYHAADLLVVSSRYESQCMAAIEAAASGLPIVATRVGILPELEGAAALAPPGNPLALAKALAGVLQDGALRRQMGLQARELATSRFLLKDTIKLLSAHYSALTRPGAPSAG